MLSQKLSALAASGSTSLLPDYLYGEVGGTTSVAVPRSAFSNTGLIAPVTKTVTYAVVAADSGKQFNNSGAAGEVDFDLPASVAGLTYTFVCITAQLLKIVASGAEVIVAGTTFSAGNISSNQPYSSITIACHIAGTWIVTSTVGTWA